MVKALLFDFDGVIVDTEVPTYGSWRDLYATFGVDLALEDYLPAVGTGSSTSLGDGGFDAVAHLERLIGRPVDREQVVEWRRGRKQELCATARLLPGVAALLGEAARLALRTAIVTRNRDAWVAQHCERLGLDHAWDEIVCANDTPAMDKAELYRRALELLGVSADEAIAIEDSPPGVEAARRTGIYCIAVPSEITRSVAFDADCVYDSLEQVPLARLVQSTETRTG